MGMFSFYSITRLKEAMMSSKEQESKYQESHPNLRKLDHSGLLTFYFTLRFRCQHGTNVHSGEGRDPSACPSADSLCCLMSGGSIPSFVALHSGALFPLKLFKGIFSLGWSFYSALSAGDLCHIHYRLQKHPVHRGDCS